MFTLSVGDSGVGTLGGAALNHEDVVNVGKLGTLPKYMGEFGV